MSMLSHWDMSTINPPDIGWQRLGNDLTGVNLVAATDIVNGVGGGMATEYDGAAEYQWRATSGIIYALVNYSVAFWMKPANPAAVYGGIFGEANSSTAFPFWRLVSDDGGTGKLQFIIRTDAGVLAENQICNTVFVADTWYHVCLSDASGVWTMYVNGTIDISATYTRGIITLDRFSLGALVGGAATNHWAGVLDEVMVFDTPLTNIQVTDLWNRTRRGML